MSTRSTIRRYFGDLEVVEAEKEIRIQPNEQDIKSAVVGDPENCVFSQACRRMWSANIVLFFGTIAYVDLLDADGKRRVERFRISPAGQRYIRAFDAGEPVDPKGFALLPPRPSETLEAECRKNTRARRALLVGTAEEAKGGSNAKRPKRKPSTGRLSTFYRHGTGMVHFTPVPGDPS